MLDIELKDVYIEPRTNFGFRYLFGTPKNKDLLIGFLNALFHGTHTITDLTYLNGEQLGIRKEDRRAIIASQLPVSKWYDVIGNEVIADTVLDRIVHSSHRFDLKGYGKHIVM